MTSLEKIAASLQGYDPQSLSVSRASDFLHQLAQPIQDTEEIPLMQALQRVLSADVISAINVPAHDNSAMDGYAFDGGQLGPDTLSLNVVGTAFAGKAWTGSVLAHQCVKIMTGAVMPQGLDTVAPQELVQVRGDEIHIAAGTLKQGDNRRFKGEDLLQGEPALRKGNRIGPAALGLLASLGTPTVLVYRKLRVAYFSTGDEILSLGESPREGAVYDSNRYTVIGMLQNLGVEVLDLGVVGDQPQALEDAFREAGSKADAIITSGGVSVGEADHTKATMKKVAGDDAAVVFWKIAMRPGRPMAVGRLGSSLLFGLPGNPVAVMVTFLAFVRPALLAMMGSTSTGIPMLRARATQAIRKRPGRTEYQRAIVSHTADGSLAVHLTGQQGSGVLSSMVQANGLLVLAHEQGDIAVGDEVEVLMFEGAL
jgi:molybdopterin molybdotransferase